MAKKAAKKAATKKAAKKVPSSTSTETPAVPPAQTETEKEIAELEGKLSELRKKRATENGGVPPVAPPKPPGFSGTITGFLGLGDDE